MPSSPVPRTRWRPFLGLLALVAVSAMDALTPAEMGFSSLYLIPVILWALVLPLGWALAAALGVGCLAAALDRITGVPHSRELFRWWDAVNRGLPLLAAVAVIHRLKALLAREREARSRLEAALSEVRELREILPVCAWCGRTRDDQGYWERLDHYLARTTRTKLTHGICPGCQAALMGKAGGPPAP